MINFTRYCANRFEIGLQHLYLVSFHFTS